MAPRLLAGVFLNKEKIIEGIEERPSYYIPEYGVFPRIYFPEPDEQLEYYQKIFNRTITKPAIINTPFLAAAGYFFPTLLCIDYCNGKRTSDDQNWLIPKAINSHVKYIDSISKMGIFDYLYEEKIPTVQKIFDLVIGFPLAGLVEVGGIALLPISATITATIVTFLFITIGIPQIIIIQTFFKCNRSDESDLTFKAILLTFSTLASVYVLSYLGMIRASLKLAPVISMPAVKVFDLCVEMVRYRFSNTHFEELTHNLNRFISKRKVEASMQTEIVEDTNGED